ncbi:hypothetical protein E8E14_011342 [Neopestalotiopsis sp. 37M]|nr:hypothetical protein E8E14_011342 [Neopestalotiopsis sp. 37M]
MSQRSSAVRNARRPRGGVSAATQNDFEMAMETEKQEDSAPSKGGESTSRGRCETARPPTPSRSKSMKRSKSVAKSSERRKSTTRRDIIHQKEENEDRLLKFVDKLATEREEREKVDKRVEELEAQLEALKISSATTEAGLKQSLSSAQTQVSQLQEAQKEKDREQVVETAKVEKSQQDLVDMTNQRDQMKGDYEKLSYAWVAQDESQKAEISELEETIYKLRAREMMQLGLIEQAREEQRQSSAKLKDIQLEQQHAKEREKVLIEERNAAIFKHEIVEERAKVLTKERDVAISKQQRLDTQITGLQEASKPVERLVVICVDCSGSLTHLIKEVQRAYRDVVLYLKAKCSDAKVAVVKHGSSTQRTHSARIVSEHELTLLDYIGFPETEDYGFCMDSIVDIFRRDTRSKKAVVMIGDGDACYESLNSITNGVNFMKLSGIPAHSLVISRNGDAGYTMKRISQETGGRFETAGSYFRALDDFVGGK